MSNNIIHDYEVYGKSRKLIVLLHAYTSSPSKMLYVRNVVIESIPDADIFIPKLPASVFSLVNPIEIVLELLNKIDQLWEQRKQREDKYSYDGIIIIGHSLGALLARKLYIYACGEPKKNLFEPDVGQKNRREWADNVERIILLAAMNRGWNISHHMPLNHTILWSIGAFIGNLIFILSKHRPLIFHIRRGAPFLTNLRVQWLAMKQAIHINKDVDETLVIQLLGSVDDIVSPDDNIDLISGEDFYYLDVPMSGHANIIDLDRTNAGEARKEVFNIALTASKMQLNQYKVLPQEIQGSPLQTKRVDVENVVFVIHGIRDLGYWTRKIARRIQKAGKAKNIIIESETSTYGYFPLLSFLLPWKRREKVEWLMDQYAEALALYPNAEFSYVGHSHGTYLLAKALQEYPSCRFKNVVFAGSVVRTDYNWAEYIEKKQVKAVLNYVATGDFVVAIFPKVFQIFGFQDLGSAGHDGFDRNNSASNIKFIKGDHGAALNELNWDSIATFIVDGEINPIPLPITRYKRSWFVIFLGKIAPIIWLLILSGLVGIGYWIIYCSNWSEWQRSTVFLVYLWSVFQILTKF